MTNATTGPVKGKPYAAIILTGSFTVERENFEAPVDALMCAVRYLKEGKQVRLTDRTVSALKESPDLEWVIDALVKHVDAYGQHFGAVPFKAPAVPGA